MKYWLMKCEPSAYSIDDLAKDKKTTWDGVRNYQARNFMRDEMTSGDFAIFYHSNAEPPGAAGIMKIDGDAIDDPEQFKKNSKYFDPKSSKEKPRWQCRQVKFVNKMKSYVSLEQIRENKKCKNMMILRPGNRLSITPMTKTEFEEIKKMGQVK